MSTVNGPTTTYDNELIIVPSLLLTNILICLTTFWHEVPKHDVSKFCDVIKPVEIVLVSYLFNVIPNEVYNVWIDNIDVMISVEVAMYTLHDELFEWDFVSCEDDLHRPFELFSGRPAMANCVYANKSALFIDCDCTPCNDATYVSISLC